MYEVVWWVSLGYKWLFVVCGVDYRNAYLGFCGVFEVVGWCWELILGGMDEYGLGFVLNDESLNTLCQRARLQRGFPRRRE